MKSCIRCRWIKLMDRAKALAGETAALLVFLAVGFVLGSVMTIFTLSAKALHDRQPRGMPPERKARVQYFDAPPSELNRRLWSELDSHRTEA